MPTKSKVVSLKDSNAIKIGIELEFARPDYTGGSSHGSREAQRNAVDSLQDAIENSPSGQFIESYGEDGGGVEVDFKPYTFSKIKEIPEKMFGFLSLVKNAKFTGENNYSGMHVHIDRNIFTPKQFVSFVDFIRNNKAQIHKFSRRGNRSSYTNIETTTGKEGYPFTKENEKDFLEYFSKSDEYVGNNCLVLNVHGKEGTIECRFFNSSTEMEIILANIEFVRALCYFIKCKRKSKTWTEFIKYAKDYAYNYKNMLTLVSKFSL